MTKKSMSSWTVGGDAATLHEDALFCDLVFPVAVSYQPVIGEYLDRMKHHGTDMVSLTMAVDIQASAEICFKRLGEYKRFIRHNSDKYSFAGSVRDIREAKAQDKLAIGFHFQGSEAVMRDLNLVQPYYDAGVRAMILAYNQQNSVGFGCMEPEDLGLTEFGRGLVDEMNTVGMLIDLSHCGYRTSMEALERSSDPVIFSHSQADALKHHNRNVKDDQIKALGTNNGLIAINGVGPFLNNDLTADASSIVDHIDYISNIIGIEKIGFGNDTIANKEALYAYDVAYPGVLGMGAPPPWEFFDVEQFPTLTEELLRRRYSEDNVRGVLGENFLRVAGAVWK